MDKDAILAKLPNGNLSQIVNDLNELESCLPSGLSHTATELVLSAEDLQHRLEEFARRVKESGTEIPAA